MCQILGALGGNSSFRPGVTPICHFAFTLQVDNAHRIMHIASETIFKLETADFMKHLVPFRLQPAQPEKAPADSAELRVGIAQDSSVTDLNTRWYHPPFGTTRK